MTTCFKMDTIKDMEKTTQKPEHCIFEATYTADTPAKLNDFLKTASPLSGRSLRQYFFKGLVRLNRKKTHSQARIKSGDLVQVYGMAEEFQVLKPESIPLNIIYEDHNLLVINKPAQLAVHPSGGITSGTLANGVAAYFEQKDLRIKVRPVNRLDYGTSGLIILAKNAQTQYELSEAIRKHLIKRIYFAVVQGVLKPEAGTIALPISEVNGRRQVNISGQPAVTHYQVIEQYPTGALLRLDIETGRTHQIRIHLQHIGHPIIGDKQYGVISQLIGRPALHAGKLNFGASSFQIPELSAPFPEDFEKLLAAVREEKLYHRDTEVTEN